MSKSVNRFAPPRIGAFVVASTLMLNIFALALPIAMLQIFDRVIPNASYGTLFMLAFGLCVITVLEFIQRWARIVLLGGTGNEFETSVSGFFLNKILRADPENFQKTTVASHMENFSAIGHLRGHYGGQGRILAIDLPFVAVFVFMIAVIGGWLVLVPIASVALLLGFRFVLKRAQSAIFQKRKTLDNRRYAFLFEVLSQLTTIKCNTMEPQLLRRYELLQSQTVKISHSLIHFSGFSQTFSALFSQSAVAAMGLFGAYLIVLGYIGIAELAACMLLNGRTVQPLLKALNLWAQSESLAASENKINEALALQQRPQVPNMSRVISGEISFEDVKVFDRRDQSVLLETRNLQINACEFVSMSGVPSQAQSEYFKLILAEIEPQVGSVRIDGREANSFGNSKGQGGILYVDRQPIKLPGTILDNLSAYGDGQVIDRALDFAKLLKIEDVVHLLPQGYNTSVTLNPQLANNTKLLLRIGIARALALQPKVLLLNDVTSGLDSSAIAAIASTLKSQKGSMTVIYAGSNQAIHEISDRSFVVNGTSIVEASPRNSTNIRNVAELFPSERGVA